MKSEKNFNTDSNNCPFYVHESGEERSHSLALGAFARLREKDGDNPFMVGGYGACHKKSYNGPLHQYDV